MALMVAFANGGAEHEDAEGKALDAFRKLMSLRDGKRNGWNRFSVPIGVDPEAIAAPFVQNVEWAMQAADAACEACFPPARASHAVLCSSRRRVEALDLLL